VSTLPAADAHRSVGDVDGHLAGRRLEGKHSQLRFGSAGRHLPRDLVEQRTRLHVANLGVGEPGADGRQIGEAGALEMLEPRSGRVGDDGLEGGTGDTDRASRRAEHEPGQRGGHHQPEARCRLAEAALGGDVHRAKAHRGRGVSAHAYAVVGSGDRDSGGVGVDQVELGRGRTVRPRCTYGGHVRVDVPRRRDPRLVGVEAHAVAVVLGP
jgi:hypothetical protein